MNMESYNAIYCLGNLFMTFVIYKYIHIFYSDCRVNFGLERLAYLGYFVLITLTYIYLKIPLTNMAVNLITLFLIAILYEGKISKALLSITIIYFSLMIIETLVAFLTSILELNLLSPFKYKSGFGIVAINILSFSYVLFVQGFKNVKTKYPLPNVYWLSLITVPLGTIVMLLTVFTNNSVSRTIIFICMASAFAINIVTFYLYDKISDLLVAQMNRRIIEEQNRYYENQVEMMESALKNMRMLRHDFKNKLSPLCELAKSGKISELTERLSELTDMCRITKEYAVSGNSTIDSIINFKLQQAEKENIRIRTDILIPADLTVETFDMAVILGNFLDNALEAVVKTEDRWIDIKIKYTKGRLIIVISNSFDGLVKKMQDSYITRKADEKNHGLGLKSVQKAIQKYDGAMQVFHDEKSFQVKVLMYMKLYNWGGCHGTLSKCTNG
ncbi:sensor histidine kinase [Lacrimispora sp. 38-1]|uniref:sensor histidine kinase n=1 Tax=Lacrimispora sp. 38-1 TaxID=3125778 RepID=UPI003CE86C2C